MKSPGLKGYIHKTSQLIHIKFFFKSMLNKAPMILFNNDTSVLSTAPHCGSYQSHSLCAGLQTMRYVQFRLVIICSLKEQ